MDDHILLGHQELSLRPPDGDGCHCLCDVGRPLHEMMHVHENTFSSLAVLSVLL